MVKTKYNMSMYTNERSPTECVLSMSMYHKNASDNKAFTYLKRTRDEDVKLTTHELVN